MLEGSKIKRLNSYLSLSMSLMRKKKKNRTGAVLYTRWAWKNLTQSKWQKKIKKDFWILKTTGGVVGSARELVLRTHVTRSELSSSVRQGKD